MKKTAIFDLDGTLLYTLEDLTDSTNYALQKFNFSKCTVEQVRSYVGNGVYKLIERALPLGSENPDFQNCLETFKKHYKENIFQGNSAIWRTSRAYNTNISSGAKKYSKNILQGRGLYRK